MNGRILVVDDEEIVIRSCLRIFADGRYEVEAVRSGAEALTKIGERDYDVVILDIMMPKMDGLKVLEGIKKRRPGVEVIMVTGLSQTESALRSRQLGAFDYLPKPFGPDELKLVVEKALEKRRQQQEGRER